MSWLNLSDNLSNLSGNFSNLTGQISNFTREVLTESTEEFYDQDAELKLAKTKLKELENKIFKQKTELERINNLNEELQEKADTAELQITALSDEYRGIIESKEREIKELKISKHNQLQMNHDESLSKDSYDFEDTEFYQMNVEKLKKELHDARTECQHWKDAAKNQNNQAELQRIKEDHQHEMASLQSMYSQRISQLNKKHQSELEDLMNENEHLMKTVVDLEAGEGNKAASNGDKEELEDKCKKLSLDFKIKKKQLESLQLQILDEKRSRKIAEEEISMLRVDNERKDEQIAEFQRKIDSKKSEMNPEPNARNLENQAILETKAKENLEELDRIWRTKFDSILHDLNEARDENVALSLELSQHEEKLGDCANERDGLTEELRCTKMENEKLIAEKKNLQGSSEELERLKHDISKLSSCITELLEELEFQKSLSEDQTIEIDSLRKICSIKGNPAEEIKNMQKALKELGKRYVELYQHYQKVSFELRKSNDRLLAERQLRHVSVAMFRDEISSAKQRLGNNADSKLDSCNDEKKSIEKKVLDLNRQVDHREQYVNELQKGLEYVSEEAEKLVSEFGCQVCQLDIMSKEDEEAATIQSLIAEKAILERTIEGLERKAGSLEEMVASLKEDNNRREKNFDSPENPNRNTVGSCKVPVRCTLSQESDLDPALSMEMIDKRPDLIRPMSIADSVVSTDGYFFDEEHPQGSKAWMQDDVEISRQKKIIYDLEATLLLREKEIFDSSAIRNNLEFEKNTLEKVVLDLQKKLKNAEKDAQSTEEVDNNVSQYSHQETATNISSLDWDSLMEARDECRELKIELEEKRNETNNIRNEISKVLLWVREQRQSPEQNEEDVRSLSILGKIKKIDEMLRNYTLEVKDGIDQMSRRNECLTNELADIDNIATDVLAFISRAWTQRSGADASIGIANISCQDKLAKLRSLLETFILECTGETDADKWQRKHDEVISEKEVALREVARLEDGIRIWMEKHQDVVDQNTSLLETNDLLRQDLELMSQGQSALMAEREQLQSELDKLQFQIDTNETDDSKEIGELKMQLDDLKIERERIMKMVNERDDFITDQQERHEHIVDQIVEEKDRALLEIQEQLEETMTFFKEKQKECINLHGLVDRLEKEAQSSDEKLDDLEKRLALISKEKDSLQEEVNDRRVKEKENEFVMRSLEQEDEVLREKEILEENLLREHEMLIDELRAENDYLKNELKERGSTARKRDESGAVKYRDLDAKDGDRDRQNEELLREIVQYQSTIASLEARLLEFEDREVGRNSPSIEINDKSVIKEEVDVMNVQPLQAGDQFVNNGEEDSRATGIETKITIEEPSNAQTQVSVLMDADVDMEKDKLMEDYVTLKERLQELEIEVQTYKGFERKADEKENEIERYKTEINRMMQVLRSKDELLLNLEMMDGDNADYNSPFSSRARVIQYIRDKETELSYTQERVQSLEEMIKHSTSQIELLKVERQNLIIFMQQKDSENIDLKERLENVQARSAAKEHASTVLHTEHQKLLELNNSQGTEIARLRERNQHLQNVLQEWQSRSNNDRFTNEKIKELEAQIVAFQQEQERLLTLIHEKDKCNIDMRENLEKLQAETNERIVNTEDKRVREKEEDRPFKMNHANAANDEIDAGIEEDNERGLELADNYSSDEKIVVNYVKPNNESSSSEAVKEGNVSPIRNDRELKSLMQKLEQLDENNLKLLNFNENLKQKLELVENEKRNLRTQMDDQLQEKEAYNRSCESHLNELKKKIIELNQSFEQERSKILQNYETKIHLLTQEWEEKVRLKDNEMKILNEKIELLEPLQKETDKPDRSRNKTIFEIESLTKENRKLRSFYEEKTHELSVLQGDIHRLKNIASATEAALNKMQTDNKYLIDQGNIKDNRIEELEKIRTLSEQRVQELETEIRRLTVNCKEIEARAAKEMERLRNHLIAIEEGYTNDAVAARENETRLEQQVTELQEALQQRYSEFKESSHHSSYQIQNLQQQLFAMTSQRDSTIAKLSQSQEKARQSEAALYNLQMALEQFQREKDSQYELLAEQSHKKLTEANKEIENLKEKEKSFQARIQEATLAVQGVANLSNQVQMKDEEIDVLKDQISKLEFDVNTKNELIRKLKDSTEGKIEKPLIKNILVGYFHTPEAKRREVIRVIGNLVGFSHEEIAEIGSGAPPSQRTWVSSLMPFGAATRNATQKMQSNTASVLSKSFTEMFVSFLEEESGADLKANRATANQLTSLLMQPPASTSTPLPRDATDDKGNPLAGSVTSVSNPLLFSTQDAKMMHATAFKTSLPLLPTHASTPAPLFPAPGQEIPRVHTSTANSALRTMLSR